MTLSIRTLSIAVALVVGPSIGAIAQTEAEAIQQLVTSGQVVSVTTDEGDEFVGKIGGITTDSLSVISKRETVTIPYPQIIKIDHAPDGLANGAKIGLLAGAALGVALIAAEDMNGCSNAERASFFGCSDPTGLAYVLGAVVCGGLGSALGVGIDALIRRDPEIYKRRPGPRITLAPAFGPRGARGAVLSASW